MKILIVDDEKRIRDVIREYATFEGYEVIEAEDGLEALSLIEKIDIDLIILDVMMPKLDGFSTYKEMKKTKNIPTIILSARGEEYDKLFGFELGIDDYLTKPFSPKELIARIKAVTKRLSPIEDKYTYKSLTIDFKGHTVQIDNQQIDLTPKEFDILTYFVNHQNTVITREQFLNKIWGYDFFGDDRTIDTHIKMLRNNLGNYRDLIQTVRGLGYKFVIDNENK